MAQDNYNYSGSFEVEECKILTHHNETIDVSDILVEINFHEDVVDGFLTGNISFTDTNLKDLQQDTYWLTAVVKAYTTSLTEEKLKN